jgi:hypothetical protein
MPVATLAATHACPSGTLAVKRSGGLMRYEMVEKD